jgi:phosphoadenosine phosphosulfate reductase
MTDQQFLALSEFNLDAMVERACEAMRQYAKPGGYLGAFSGGKDSIVIKQLALEAGLVVDWHYHQTTIDPPELVRFIKHQHADVVWDKPREHLLTRAVIKGLPTRRVRWCCQEYKETHDESDRTVILGIRSSESPRRASSWQLMQRTRAHIKAARQHWALCPIIDWRDEHVWAFIRGRGLAYCELYDEGFKRLGCVGCPMAGDKRAVGFRRWPGFERLWQRAARRCWDRQLIKPVKRQPSWMAYWDAWLHDKSQPADDECQLSLALSGGIG